MTVPLVRDTPSESSARISGATRAMTASRSAEAQRRGGVRLGNRTNLGEAGRRGVEAWVAEAERHTRNVLPLIREVQAARARSLVQIAAALNARGVPTARGGSWAAALAANADSQANGSLMRVAPIGI
jgi:hypothetical protein